MFNSDRYLTRGVQAEIPFELQLFMWYLVSNLPEPKDYLQVFRLYVSDVPIVLMSLQLSANAAVTVYGQKTLLTAI